MILHVSSRRSAAQPNGRTSPELAFAKRHRWTIRSTVYGYSISTASNNAHTRVCRQQTPSCIVGRNRREYAQCRGVTEYLNQHPATATLHLFSPVGLGLPLSFQILHVLCLSSAPPTAVEKLFLCHLLVTTVIRLLSLSGTRLQ